MHTGTGNHYDGDSDAATVTGRRAKYDRSSLWQQRWLNIILHRPAYRRHAPGHLLGHTAVDINQRI